MGDVNWLSSESDAFGSCPSVDQYQKAHRIGEGTYGYVYKAIHKSTQRIVALKRIILHNEAQDGFPLTSIREIKTLRTCKHPNIVELYDVVVGPNRDAVFLLFELCETDLHMITKSIKHPFKESEIKCLALQLLHAVEFIHKHWIVHRDIKLSNLLYDRGVLKLADFGLARTLSYPPPADLTVKVVTLWYRAPELLLGSESYSFSIDIWSVGCVLGELLAGRPLMDGDSEAQQIEAIFSLLGAPNDKIWPDLASLPLIRAQLINLSRDQMRYPYNQLAAVLPDVSPEGLDLLNAFFTYAPSARIHARDALRHNYFRCKPFPVAADLMPTFPSPGQSSQHPSITSKH